ncbi:IPExxxVDY family protein [Flavobacteriaceae bacterium]|nr:IPExxxVDY family protein [Flavobacteriaceae bacterium]
MAIKHYLLDEVPEEDFSLIAINCSCEGYLLAYMLNTHCQSKFTLQKKNNTKNLFESYEWLEPIKGIEVRLFFNRCIILQDDPQKGTSLFDLPETKELYLVNDLKDVDYIIIINSGVEVLTLLKKMESINQISHRFLPDQSQLNLDFSLNLY